MDTERSASEATWLREKGKLIFITHTSGVRRKGSPLSEKAPFYIKHYLGLRNLSCFFTRGQIPIYIVYTVLEHTLLNYKNTIQTAEDIQMHRDSTPPCTTANCGFFFHLNENLKKLSRPRLFKWQTGLHGDCKKTLLFQEAAAKCK